MIITIDGTTSSGKSTAAARLARRLGAIHLDTGAMYRAVTLKALATDVDLEDAEALARLAAESDVELAAEDGRQIVRLDGRDVTDQIRVNRVSTNAHYVARTPEVRRTLVEKQRRFAHSAGDVVAEGRDQGTVVFPEAACKFFLDAAPEARARRRQQELHERGEYPSFEQVLDQVKRRDETDRNRDVGPLRPAEDAIHLDTTDLGIEEMVDALEAEVRRCGGES